MPASCAALELLLLLVVYSVCVCAQRLHSLPKALDLPDSLPPEAPVGGYGVRF